MNKKLQVFVSSTYTDMRSERQAAVEAILQSGHIPAGMELFAAGNETQMEIIRRWIDDSDVFMLILGGRYGSIEPKSKKSYIELEYNYAIEKNKPLFSAVASDEYIESKLKSTLGINAIERDNTALLNKFKEQVRKRICKTVEELKDLATITRDSLREYEKIDSLIGWVRSSELINNKKAREAYDKQARDAYYYIKSQNDLLHSQINQLSEQKQSTKIKLSSDAIELLKSANNSGGRLMYLRHLNGVNLSSGNRSFIEDQTHREQARWKSALDELSDNNIIRDVGFKGEIFEITHSGYTFLDELLIT